MTSQRPRGNFAGALRIARYNWPFYAVASVVLVAGIAVAALPLLPGLVRALAGIAAAVAGWFAFASLFASHWVFDRSSLTRWRWLADVFPRPPTRWVHVNAGLEETSAPLAEIFPGSEGKVLDIYDPAAMTEPAIARARRMTGAVPAERASVGSLPVPDDWADAVFLLMTAHEIRKAEERDQFFSEVGRILAMAGRVVLVEHLRDFFNALAFGPGFFHFLPRSEWLRVTAKAGLVVGYERRFTPFVRVLVFRKLAVQAGIAEPVAAPDPAGM